MRDDEGSSSSRGGDCGHIGQMVLTGCGPQGEAPGSLRPHHHMTLDRSFASMLSYLTRSVVPKVQLERFPIPELGGGGERTDPAGGRLRELLQGAGLPSCRPCQAG